MTLSTFKERLKAFTVIVFLGLWGLGFFFAGKFLTGENLSKIKGTSINESGGIEKPIESPIPFSDTQTGSVISSFVKLCSNTAYGFELAYPKDWFTTYNIDPQKCTFFAPFSFIIPADTSNFLIPIRIEVINTPDWQETVKFYQNPNDFQNVISSLNLEINGRLVIKINATTTQAGFVPRGFAKISYLVFDSETPLAITYQQLNENENVEQFEKILEEMASTLKFF